MPTEKKAHQAYADYIAALKKAQKARADFQSSAERLGDVDKLLEKERREWKKERQSKRS